MDRKIKKRKYSRKGCIECKRRKIKCDETDPECYNCTRLKKKCVYFIGNGMNYAGTESPSRPVTPVHGQIPGQIPGSGNFTQPLPRSEPDSRPGSAKPMELLDPGQMKLGQEGQMGQINEMPQIPNQMSPIQNQLHNQLPLQNELPLSSQIPSQIPGQIPGQMGFGPDYKDLYQEASVLVNDIHHFLETDQWAEPEPFRYGLSPNPSLASNEKFQVSIDDFPTLFGNNTYMSPTGITEQLARGNSELIDRVVAENRLEQPHAEYLHTLTTTELSYHMFPFASSIESNEVVKLLLTYSVKCKYLLSSLLAISATFQFNRTGKKCHEAARQKYTAMCFSALSDAFTENSGFSNAETFTSNVENLLLTVLVLSSTFTASAPAAEGSSSWFTHLRGARDLLLNFSKLNPGYMSQGVALAKCWFFAIEGGYIAYVFFSQAPEKKEIKQESPNPESQAEESQKSEIQKSESQKSESQKSSERSFSYNLLGPDPAQCTDYELLIDTGAFDAHADYHRALQSVNLIVPTATGAGFNLFLGLSHTYVRLVLEFVAIREAAQKQDLKEVPYRWKMRLSTLVEAMYHDVVVPQVSLATFEIPKSSEAHPDFAGDKMAFPPSCYGVDVDISGKKTYYSWFDASQQLHTDGLNLRMLASKSFTGLRRSHPDIQYHIDKIFKGMFFFKRKDSPSYERDRSAIILDSENYYLSKNLFDNRCIMLQSVFRVLTGTVVEEEHFELIELFFMGLVKLGNGSSLSFLDVLAKIREIRKTNREKLGDEPDDETYDFYGTMDNMFFA